MSFAPFYHIDGNYRGGMLLTADHAMRALPAEYGNLGLAPAQFERHIAYDIGVEALTRALAAKLEAPAILGGFSRLLIDPNRGEDDPTLIMQLSDGAVIPGNYPMSGAERQKRITHYYQPYHAQLALVSERVAAECKAAPFIVSIHSFTPHWKGKARPWHIGLLWDRDDRATLPLLESLRADHDIVVGDNEPYDGALKNDALYRHATAKGFAHVLIEVRQDLIADQAGALAWAERLAPKLAAINQMPAMHEVRHFGSRSDLR